MRAHTKDEQRESAGGLCEMFHREATGFKRYSPATVSAFSEWALAFTADDKSTTDLRFHSTHKRDQFRGSVAEILSELIESWTDDNTFSLTFEMA